MESIAEALYQKHYGESPAHLASAPGRIEFIGNHTDYNGGLVLGSAINRHILTAIGPRTDNQLSFHSDFSDSSPSVTLDQIVPFSGENAWANYPLGVLKVMIDAGMKTDHGFNVAVASNLPAGSGLSSSAALELSSGFAYSALYGFEVSRKEMALLGQRAENSFVGVPCGILDQAVSMFGEENALVLIDCIVNEFTPVAIPAGLHFWIFNPNIKHTLVDSLYAERHRECREALNVLQSILPGRNHLAEYLPSEIRDTESHFDPVVFKRALHITEDHSRVKQMLKAIENGDLKRMGALLSESHISSRDFFENSSPEQDTLVETLNGRGDVLGARLMGGGFGGAVLALTTHIFTQSAADSISTTFQGRFGSHSLSVFHVETGQGARLIK